jgi:hypothetical protein
MTQQKCSVFYKFYDLKRKASTSDQIKKILPKENILKIDKHQIIGGLPPELLAVFLLSQSNTDCELIYHDKGISKEIVLSNIENSGSKFSDVLIGVELNENIITREMMLLNGQVIRAKGAPQKKSSVEVMIKCYEAYRDNLKERISLRKLIEFVNQTKGKHKADGRQNQRALMQILLLSRVELYSSINDQITLPSTKLFTIVSNEADSKQALRDLIIECRKKDDNNSKKGGKKSGRIMDICRNIYVNFSGSAFARIFELHNKQTKKGKKAIGSYFKYDCDLDPSAARLAAFLDFYKPYIQKLGETGCKLTMAKTFGMDSILAIAGVESEFKKNQYRFFETCGQVSNFFGEITYSKDNFSILFKNIDSGQNGEDPPKTQGRMGEDSGQNGEDSGQNGEDSGQNGETPQNITTETSTKKPLVTDSNLYSNNTSKEKFASELSDDTSAFISSMTPLARKREKAKAKAMGIVKYEKELRQTKGFFNYLRKSTKENAHAS